MVHPVLSLTLSLITLLPYTLAISTISAVGSKFFTSDGNQFFIKGIAYQLSVNDPLTDGNQCQQDANLMKTLGANSIRVYHVDATANHDACMKAFSDVGIYAWVDLDTFSTYINLGPTPSWNQTQFDKYSAVLDTFQKYDNLAGFFVGNEVLEVPADSPSAAYVKAAARDMKAYRDSKSYRQIPIGYSAADIASLRPMLQNYLACGGNASESVDFFSLNAYEWCGDVDYHTSGYINLQSDAEGYPIPIFFSETGCNVPEPRNFADQSVIFGSDMVGTWSGAIIYEWIQEANNYGLIEYNGGNTADIIVSGTPTPIAPDFTNLKSQWATLSPSGVKLSDYTASAGKLTTPACPASTANGWAINGNPAIPHIGQTFNAAGSNLPSATGAGPTPTPAQTTQTQSGALPAASAKNGSANGGKEVAGMAVALGSVMLAFIVWL